jgi:uncharacterized protein YndB with AHSA1/START domain
MSTETIDTSINQALTVDAPRERAFSVFTEGLDSWFPREYNLLSVDIEERTFEPREGGRIYDRGTDGSECSWGKVLAYEPPARVVFAWAISPQWQIEDDDAKVSEVEVRFTEESPGRTLVELEHRHLDRHGDGWEQLRESLTAEGGWQWCLQRFAEQLPS